MPRETRRVALVCPSLDYGGAERHLVRLARALRGSAFEPTVVVLDPHAANPLRPEIEASGARVLVPPYARNHPLAATWLARWLRSGEVDVAHSFLWRADVQLALAARLARFTRVIASERGDRLMPAYWSPAWRKRRWLDRRLTFRAARRLVANSDAGRAAVARAGYPQDRVVVIPNWVDLEEVDGARAAGMGLRSHDHLADRIVVGFVGRLAPDKGALEFVRVARAIAKRCTDRVRFVMVGDGFLRSSVEAHIGAAGLTPQFLLAGAVSDPLAFMHAMDVGVICSPSESLPNVLLEFMACGKPVVAPAVGGLGEVIADRVTGRLVAPGSTETLAEACAALLDAADERQAMGVAARRAVETRFQPAGAVVRYLDLYEQVADGL